MPKQLDPRGIRFTHDSILETFDDGERLEDTLNDLKDGKYNVGKIPRITVVLEDGMHFSLNNRRLWVFKEYAKFIETTKNEVLQVPVKFGTSKSLNARGLTTTNEGKRVKIKPKRSEDNHMSVETVRLSDVLYSTDTLSHFSKNDGGYYERLTIDDDLKRFSSNILESKQLPVLKVVRRKDRLHALDNLQLWLLKKWYQNKYEDNVVEDKTIENETMSEGSGNENPNYRAGVKDTVNNLGTSTENEWQRNRMSTNTLETVIYHEKVSDGYQGVEDNPKSLDIDLKTQHGGQNAEDITKIHAIETKNSKQSDILNGGEHVLVELRPYCELMGNITTTNEGRSVKIVLNDTKSGKGRKFKPLTRQNASQAKNDLLKYCKGYEDQPKETYEFF